MLSGARGVLGRSNRRETFLCAFACLLIFAWHSNLAEALEGYGLGNAFGVNIRLREPVCLRSPPAETNRIFILEKNGLIQVLTNIGASTPAQSVYMDLRNNLSTLEEQGLLGLAFHPQFQSNGYFYVYRSYMPPAGSLPFERLSRFQANPPSAPTALINTEVVLFDQYDDDTLHNGGDLHFGGDGYLYVSVGDGGGQNDHFTNSQTIRKGFHAGILRIDVDNRPGNLAPNPPSSISGLTVSTNYSVPADNPFVTNTFAWERNTDISPDSIRTELWAVGLRNPWRFSIDPVTGWVWVGDVGGNVREEVDVLTAGGNYGWVYREGSVAGPRLEPADFTSTPPVYDYAHGPGTNEGNCIIGGLVYRGDRLRELAGAYIFCDFASGNIWALRYDGVTVTNFHNLLQNGSPLIRKGIVAFGTDPRNGDILMAEIPLGSTSGFIRRLLPVPPTLTVINGPAVGQYILSWPALPDAFDLQSANDLTRPISWSGVDDARVLTNDHWTVTVDATNQSQFFRLQSR